MRFNEKQIVRSSHFPGCGWSEEQISDHLIGRTLKQPLRGGQTFVVRLTVLQAIFQVHINDELYCTYDHVRPDCGIRCVRVQHDFERIECLAHRQLFPVVWPVQNEPEPGSCDSSGDYVFVAEVPQPIAVGTAVDLSGWIAGQRNAEFAVDILANDSQRVLFRLAVRFGERLLVRNAQRLDGRFHRADEERRASVAFPFKRGREFRLVVHVTRECYVVYVNGALCVRFNHRQQPVAELAMVKCWASRDAELAVQRVGFVADFVAPSVAAKAD